jgi:hypothetical protein
VTLAIVPLVMPELGMVESAPQRRSQPDCFVLAGDQQMSRTAGALDAQRRAHIGRTADRSLERSRQRRVGKIASQPNLYRRESCCRGSCEHCPRGLNVSVIITFLPLLRRLAERAGLIAHKGPP